MARLFDDASNEFGTSGNAVVSAYPCSFAAWYNTNSTTVNQSLLSVGDTAGDNDYVELFLRKAGVRALRLIVVTGGTNSTATASTQFSANTWEHAGAVLSSSTSRTVYHNGGGAVTDTTSLGFSGGVDTTSVGRTAQATPTDYMSGDIAEVGVWDAALTAGEIAALAAGACPLNVRPQSLVAYWPLWGTSSPEIDIVGGFHLTLTGTTKSAHYQGQRGRPARLILPASAAAFDPADGFPWRDLERPVLIERKVVSY